MAPAADADPLFRDLLAALEAEPARRWTEADIVARGFDPSTVRRSFKRQFGITFLEMARLSRLRDGFVTLSNGGRVIDAQLDAGFRSPSGFRAAFARLLGQSPARFTGREALRADWIATPLGTMIAVSDSACLHLLEFVERRALPAELKTIRMATGHEERIGALLAEQLPDVPFTLSHRLNPAIREFRRASSAAVDASLKPIMGHYMRSLESRLRDSGFAGRTLIVTSQGGVIDAADAADAPIHIVNSGPSMFTVFLQALLPPEWRVFREAFVYLVVIAVLIFRPQGLFRSAAARERI